jgi:GTPase
MAFVDEIKVFIEAGRGGDGVVRWLHEKGKEFGGPSGGDGGKGGNVYVHAVRDLSILNRYKHKKKFKAENGEAGKNKAMHGKDGGDLIIDVPVGTVITNRNTGRQHFLVKEKETLLLLAGGKGGFGNDHFKSSTNIRPREWTQGEKGEQADFLIELELIADAGFIGLPNAGKSSLLNALTNAHSKVGAYSFTTLSPNLGDFYGFILADIPGLIEGASHGKGLGFSFLRHVKRTKIILHCVSLENKEVQLVYRIVRGELKEYGEGLSDKKEILLLTKSDLVDEYASQKAFQKMKEILNDVFIISIHNPKSIKDFQDFLIHTLRNLEN